MGATAIVDTLGDLSPDWFTAILREGGTIGKGAEVTSADSRAIGTGQLGSVVLSRLDYGGAPDAPASLIVKLPSQDETARQMGVALKAYEAEVRFYREIAPRVEVPLPHVHWGDLEAETGRFTLVLEDLSPKAEVGDAIAGGTPEQMELAMRELAGLQAPTWDSEEMRRLAWLSDTGRTQMLFGAAPQAIGPFVERFGSLLEPEHVALARELAPKGPSVIERIWHPPFVVSHGDYRIDNFMFGADGDAPPLTVIDWQGARLGIPGLDPAYCLASSLSAGERRAHESELLHSYHDALLTAGVEGFSFEQCRESYRAGSLWPLLALIPATLTLERTERGDQMLAGMVRNAAELVADTRAAELLA